MYPRNSKKRRGVTSGDEGKGKKAATRHYPLKNTSASGGKEDLTRYQNDCTLFKCINSVWYRIIS